VQEVRSSLQRHAGREELPATSAAPAEHKTPAEHATPALIGRLHALAELLIVRRGPYAEGFENLIVALIILSIASIGVAAIPVLPYWADRALRIEEIVVVAVFSFEYLLRIVAAQRKLAYIFSFQGVVDLLAIAPTFLIGFDARWLRALRLLRLLRLLKLQTHFLEQTVAERTRELAVKNAALEESQAQIKAELDAARALQLAILPASFPARSGYLGAARMCTATTMCGDFYDFIELPDGKIGVVMADVSGHGVPAAFFMAVARTSLRDVAAQYTDPGVCLAHTNEALCAQNPMDLFVTVFYCVLDPASGLLRYANGGHNPPYLRHADGSVEALDGAGALVLGVMPQVAFPDHSVTLRPGDRVVLYTDGVTEACNSSDEAYGPDRLVALIAADGGAAPAELVERICRSATTFTGTVPQADDMTVAVLAREAH
jgi:phosphoserine phosphatase RsbU/P